MPPASFIVSPPSRLPSCLLALGIGVPDFLWGRSLDSVFWIPYATWLDREVRLDKYVLTLGCLMKAGLPPPAEGIRQQHVYERRRSWTYSTLPGWAVLCWVRGPSSPSISQALAFTSPEHGPADLCPQTGYHLGKRCFNKHTLVYIEEKRMQRKRIRGEGANMFGKFREIWMVQMS